jgi:hypothetical protein
LARPAFGQALTGIISSDGAPHNRLAVVVVAFDECNVLSRFAPLLLSALIIRLI